MNQSDNQTKILNKLGEEINLALCSLDKESNFPSIDADGMDDRLKFFGERVELLRKIRRELEDNFCRVTP